MKKINILIVLLMFVASSYSQHSYDTVRYVVNGNTYSQGYTDLIIKNDTVYCVGYDNSCGNQRSLIAVYDTALNLITDKSIGQENFINYKVAIDTLNGEIILGGVTNNTISNGYNFSLSKLTTQGIESNFTIYEKDEWYILNDILAEQSDSSIYSCGKKLTPYNDWQAVITKSDKDLDTKWEIEFGGAGIEMLNEICKLNDTAFVATGYTDSYGNGLKDLLLICFSDKGLILWQQYIGGTHDDYGIGVLKTNDGGIAVIGATASFNTPSDDKYIIKTDNLGALVWSNLYQTSDPQNIYKDKGNDLVQLPNDDFLVVSSSKSYGSIGHTDIRIMKTNPQGWWQGDHYLIGSSEDEAVRTVLYNDSIIFFVGYSMSYGSGGKDALLGKGQKFPSTDPTLKVFNNSSTCYLNKEEKIKELRIYPNPTKNILNIKSSQQIEEIKLFSLSGKLILNKKCFTKEVEILLERYPSGVYYLHVMSDNSNNVRKIVKIN